MHIFRDSIPYRHTPDICSRPAKFRLLISHAENSIPVPKKYGVESSGNQIKSNSQVEERERKEIQRDYNKQEHEGKNSNTGYASGFNGFRAISPTVCNHWFLAFYEPYPNSLHLTWLAQTNSQ
uniref:Uncharacterized protein n=1 Tax=Trichobilharzia regenti TaxID=157069 RepID=A0AA85JQ35_TRIRE|nr:unnamed protein product [Trichobilharzia regenti]